MDKNLKHKLHVHQHFYSVGNGLFYSFDISDHDTREEELLFVYDCGTKSQYHFINTELKTFEKYHGEKKPIHLLVLSRFDEAYFRHLHTLLDGREKGEMVFLPQLSRSEKLFHHLAHGVAHTDEAYANFINAPEVFLSKYFKKVFLIKKAVQPLSFNPNQVEFGTDFLELVSSSTDGIVIDDNAYVKSKYGWIFYFYVSTPDVSKSNQVEEFLKKMNVFEKSFSEILGNPLIAEQLRFLFDELGWTAYESALACVHGPGSVKQCFPTGFWYSRRSWHFLEYRLHRSRWLSFGGKDFCVLSGGMDLSASWQNFRCKMQKISQRISIFLVPHQGASRYWNKKIVEDIDPDAWILSSRLFSFLIPDHRIISDLKHRSRGGDVYKVHEFSSMTIERIFILNI